MNLRRAKTIFVKELVDILRDHRTLAAMIVAPIVLYPLLMLGGIQAATSQAREIKKDDIVVGFVKESDWEDVVKPILLEDHRILRRQLAEAKARSASDDEIAEIPIAIGEKIRPLRTDVIRESLLQRKIQCAIILNEPPESDGQTSLTIVVQQDEMRSQIAGQFLEEAFMRVRDEQRDRNLARLHIPIAVVEPIVLTREEITTPGSVLGLILPFILVLMTVTGAIYPAIDLTAGERERGTLESLMVCPVPVMDLIVGKFMAVTTIAIIAAALNIASVTATVYFGGLGETLMQSAEDAEQAFPLWAFPVVLFSLIPFAVLMSAIMIAVCSCARTFKEAQNYVMPVIMLVLVPGGIAALPASRLEGVMIVLPVANMVLLTRELLSGVEVSISTFLTVLLSTSLYAAVAVTVAAQVFGKESVLFADSISLRAIVSRRLMKPQKYPSLSLAGLYAAVLFPVWFYLQNSLQLASPDNMESVLLWTTALMPVFFVLAPVGVALYAKINTIATFRLRLPRWPAILGAIFVGSATWVLAHELFVFQDRLFGTPDILKDSGQAMTDALQAMPFAVAVLVIAIGPALCEELFFRGFLLSGLRTSMRKWPAILCGAAAFGAFHFLIFRFPVTATLGVLLGWICWQSRSIWPAVIVHAMHNGSALALARAPALQERLGLSESGPPTHLPPLYIAIAVALLAIGGFLISITGDRSADQKYPAH